MTLRGRAGSRIITVKPQHRGGSMAKARRTTHRSTAGKKLYAVRDAKGRFKDIQTYERAHRADLAHTSKAEAAKKAAKKKAAKKR
jgi:hypothetical protein